MEIAEDIASDTFLTAAQTWSLGAVPVNPVAWLYSVAKNKTKNYLQRRRLFENKISPELEKEEPVMPDDEIDLSPESIQDSQLQMMFAVCHPAIPVEAQICLSLRILCGFGIEEIANAFLTNKETINKRLQRAKEKIRQEKIAIEMPRTTEIHDRLNTVVRTIYLLFSEGYYSTSQDETIRKDFCLEAMRLGSMLAENKLTDLPAVNALLALMCFHASRFEARLDKKGELILYDDQDTSLWNIELISKGAWYLHHASTGDRLSKYHLEASIAYWHTQRADTDEKWEAILQLYNRLLQIEYSPIAALNRAFALSKVRGKKAAIIEAEKLQLNNDHFYFVLLGELYLDIDDNKARENFKKAFLLAKSKPDKLSIQKKLDKLVEQ